MLSYWISLIFGEADLAFVVDHCRLCHGVSLFFALFGAAALVSWRIWVFTIKPFLWQTDPKELPYWIPCT